MKVHYDTTQLPDFKNAVVTIGTFDGVHTGHQQIIQLMLDEAKKTNPDNPRVYLLEAQDKYFTPEQFGGSKEEAKVLFEKAQKLYETFKPETSIHPNWGKNQVAYFLSQYK